MYLKRCVGIHIDKKKSVKISIILFKNEKHIFGWETGLSLLLFLIKKLNGTVPCFSSI